MVQDSEGTGSTNEKEARPRFLTAFQNADGSVALRFATPTDKLIWMNDDFEIRDATEETTEFLAALGENLVGVSKDDGTYASD